VRIPRRSYREAITRTWGMAPERGNTIMPFFDDYEDSFNATAIDSFNNETDNTLTADLTVTDAGNSDESVNDSYNLGVDITDSGNTDSHDMDVEDSGNIDTDESTNDSYNTFTFTSTDDHSIHVGNRDYNTGFGDLTVGGGAAAAAAAGEGSLSIDGRATIVDQSVNQNIDAGLVFQHGSSSAVVASGDDAVAAGDDVHIRTELDTSTHIEAGGDVNVGNETTTTNTLFSNNTYTDNSVYTDESMEVDIDDSWNDNSESYTATDSFNTTVYEDETTNVDIDVDAIVDSFGATIADDVSF
jgi:hypothetical protein